MKPGPPAISMMAIFQLCHKYLPSSVCNPNRVRFPLKKEEDTNFHTSNFFQTRPAISSLSFVQLPCHTNIVDPGVLHRAFFSLPLRPIRRSHRHCPLGPVRSWNRCPCCKPEKKSGSPLLMELMDTLSIIFSHGLQGFYTSQVIKPDFYHQQYEYYNVN